MAFTLQLPLTRSVSSSSNDDFLHKPSTRGRGSFANVSYAREAPKTFFKVSTHPRKSFIKKDCLGRSGSEAPGPPPEGCNAMPVISLSLLHFGNFRYRLRKGC